MDNHAPLINRSTSAAKREPWWNDAIFESQRKARQAERKWRKSKSKESQQEYFEARNEWKQMLEISKQEYYTSLILENSADSKQLFQTVNKIMHRTNDNPMPEHESAKKMANEFSDFFTAKIEKIRNNFEKDTSLAFEYDGGEVLNPLLQLRELTVDEVKLLIRKSNDKFCELDPIPTTLVKTCVDKLAPVITRIINLALTTA